MPGGFGIRLEFETFIYQVNLEGPVKSRKIPIPVIPAKAGIQ